MATGEYDIIAPSLALALRGPRIIPSSGAARGRDRGLARPDILPVPADLEDSAVVVPVEVEVSVDLAEAAPAEVEAPVDSAEAAPVEAEVPAAAEPDAGGNRTPRNAAKKGAGFERNASPALFYEFASTKLSRNPGQFGTIKSTAPCRFSIWILSAAGSNSPSTVQGKVSFARISRFRKERKKIPSCS